MFDLRPYILPVVILVNVCPYACGSAPEGMLPDDGGSSSPSTGVATTTTTDPTTTDPTTTTTTTNTSTTGPDPVCGDGSLDPGEACDDGDIDDTNACTNACTVAVCGDGIVGPGEACDDGNKDDTDDCTSACASPSCGDGVVQDPEACDDGNQDDTDACLSTCQVASCGDMAVQAGVEDCDDGNQDDTDVCSNLCVSATCMDGVKNAAETDVDCGGDACPKCALGDECAADLDCAVGICSQNKCVSNKSCKSLFDADNTLKDGKYTIDPDEDGPVEAFEAYCDMTHDGGGWTLIMKVVGTNFPYEDELWENDLTADPTDFDFATEGKKSKYQTFLTVGFGELRSSTTDGAASHVEKLAAPVASATALFTGPGVEISKTILNEYFNGLHIPYDQHFAGCVPSTKYVNFGINLKDINGDVFLGDGPTCDWNGGARFGQRVNASHDGTGDHTGQGWGAYTTINPDYVVVMTQLLWVR